MTASMALAAGMPAATTAARCAAVSTRQKVGALLDNPIPSMLRILAQHGDLKERRNRLRHPQHKKPELLATGSNQVWSWDITKLPGPAKWTYFHLCVIPDIFSRNVV